MPTKIPQSTVAALIVNHNGEALLLKSHKWGGKLGLPAGKVEYGESLATALRREVEEETGIQIKDIRSLGVQEIINPSDFHKEAHFISHPFLATATDTHVTLNNEAEEFIWIHPHDALCEDLNQPTQELLTNLLETEGCIEIKNLKFDCIVGINPEERVAAQPLVLSVALETNTSGPAKSGNIDETIDYFKLSNAVKERIIEKKFFLLETLVEDIANFVLKNYRCSSTTIRAEKPNAIAEAEAAVVEITRKTYFA